MQNSRKKYTRWLLPAVLILFLLEIFTLPLVLEITYAGRSEAPDHTLTYTPGSLKWDDDTGVDRNGAAVLSFFRSQYDGTVKAQGGDHVVAPGTDGFHIVRLKNDADRPVRYTAVLYEIKDNPALPVKAQLQGSGFNDTETYTLPEKGNDFHVLRAVSGKVGRGELQDFDIHWKWNYEENDTQNTIDTLLGDQAAKGAADDLTVGLYLVVEDDHELIRPNTPKTGDAGVGMYAALMLISALLLVSLAVTRWKERKCEE